MTIREFVPWRSKGGVPVRRIDEAFRSLFDEVQELFDRFFKDFEIGPSGAPRGTFTPRIDLTENDKGYRLTAELPGMDEKDIEVILDEDVLTIKGEKKQEKDERGKDYYYAERSYGSFQRTIPLPTEVDKDKVKAKFKKGILTVELPKTKEALKEIKKIPVESE